MTRIGKVPGPAVKISGPGGGRGITAQGVRSGAGNSTVGTLRPANTGRGTRTYKGVMAKAQVTGLTKKSSNSVSGGKVGKTGKG